MLRRRLAGRRRTTGRAARHGRTARRAHRRAQAIARAARTRDARRRATRAVRRTRTRPTMRDGRRRSWPRGVRPRAHRREVRVAHAPTPAGRAPSDARSEPRGTPPTAPPAPASRPLRSASSTRRDQPCEPARMLGSRGRPRTRRALRPRAPRNDPNPTQDRETLGSSARPAGAMLAREALLPVMSRVPASAAPATAAVRRPTPGARPGVRRPDAVPAQPPRRPPWSPAAHRDPPRRARGPAHAAHGLPPRPRARCGAHVARSGSSAA